MTKIWWGGLVYFFGARVARVDIHTCAQNLNSAVGRQSADYFKVIAALKEKNKPVNEDMYFAYARARGTYASR